ncbi:unnamed protein product [Brachionus calyciflorus]|uniref:C2H2-type domain-containing protein n=1 Tax=Brachionus calyciflorus TaxID=104777 RepID=A0A814S8Y5_9BILA|nr:unnamed protein product [Brachionus calyciflorus]
MDLRSQKITNMISMYDLKLNKDPKWDDFKENIIPSIIDLNCFYCKKEFSCDFSLKRHYFTLHIDLLPTGTFHTQSKADLNCVLCRKSFSRSDKLKDHLNNSKQHKQAVSSISNMKGTIRELLPKASQTKRKCIQEDEQNMIDVLEFCEPEQKKSKHEQTKKVLENSQKNIQDEQDENDEIIILEEKDPLKEELEKLSKEELLEMKDEIKVSILKLKNKYIKVKQLLEKLE